MIKKIILKTLAVYFLSINLIQAAESRGMPQLDPEFWFSQIFWLVLTFGILYLVLSKFILPKISDNLETRKSQILDNLELAEKQRNDSEAKLKEFENISFEETAQICEGVELARRLVAAPPNSLTPLEMSIQASQIAKDNNTTLAAIKKANPNITDIHSIRPGQKVKVPKVKGRKSVYQGLSKSELKGKPPARVKPSKKYPFGFGPDNMGNVVKKASGGKVRKYKEAGSVGGRMLPRIRKPTKPKGVGAATKGWGKTGRH